MTRITLTHDAINTTDVTRAVEGPDCGAVVTFTGVTRDNALGHRVQYLEYEGYEPLALAELERIIAEAEAQWPVRVAISHRLGRVNIGECSVVVAVAAPHRAEAFAACAWTMDALKARVPLWKKEHVEGGVHWIEGPAAVPAEATP